MQALYFYSAFELAISQPQLALRKYLSPSHFAKLANVGTRVFVLARVLLPAAFDFSAFNKDLQPTQRLVPLLRNQFKILLQSCNRLGIKFIAALPS